MSEANGTGIHVVRVQAESLHRLRFAQVELTPEGQLVRVTGKNGAGKSSLLRVIREALGGAGEVLPATINEGSEDGTGSVRVELSNGFTIQRRFTEANPKGYLTVVGPDGGKHGQGRINEWLGRHHSFDVLSIFDLKPERLTEILLGLASDPDLATKLDAVRAEHAELYEERTPHIAEQRRCRAVKQPEGERPEPVDVSGEMAKLRELQAAQQRQQGQRAALAAKQREIERNAQEQLGASNEVTRLQDQLDAAIARLQRLTDVGSELAAEQAELEAVYHSEKSVDADIEAVQARISEADLVNAALDPWREYERAQASLEKATAEVERITQAMGAARTVERDLIAASGIPVEGLTFDPETAEPLLNGRPLAVASGGEKIRMALDIAIAADPELRVVLIDEANDLDLDALRELGEVAKERDFQLWLCRIGLESPGEIVVEDGEARSREPTEVAVS